MIAPSAASAAVAPSLPPRALGQREERYTLILRTAGGDTVAIERVTRTPARLDGDLVVRVGGGGRVTYTAWLGGGATVVRLELASRPAGDPPTAPPAQRVRVSMAGDSVIAEVTTGGRTRTERFASARGAIPYINPSFALVEQAVLRARVIGGARVDVPFVNLAGGQTVAATVARVGADSVTIGIGGSESRLAIDPTGALRGGIVPAQRLVLERRAALAGGGGGGNGEGKGGGGARGESR